MQETVLAELRGHFRPEFLNRVDELIVFHGLSQEHLREIVKIQLSHLRARLAERGIELALDTRSLDYLAEVGYDPHYGARPVKRAIQKLIENEVSRQIVAGQIRDGAIVRVNHGIEGLEFAVDSGGQQAVQRGNLNSRMIREFVSESIHPWLEAIQLRNASTSLQNPWPVGAESLSLGRFGPSIL